MAASEFAKRQLKKHGWAEGSGLGKQEDGRNEPIKVSLKMDRTGVGHDPGKEFTDHWWLRVFNEAAQKIGKKQNESASDNDAEVGQKKKAESKKNMYSNFVKSSVLTNGIEKRHKDSDSSSEDETDKVKGTNFPTLNDIHKFCGGATGHKAARFGIKMNGKLARIAEHDKIYQEKLEKEKLPPSVSTTELPASTCVSDLTEHNQLATSSCPVPDGDIHSEDGGERRKRKRHKLKKKEYSPDASGDQHLSDGPVCGQDELDVSSDSRCKKDETKRKHKKKKHQENGEHNVIRDCTVPETEESRKKKKKRKREGKSTDNEVRENDRQDIKTTQINKDMAEGHTVQSRFVEDIGDESSNVKRKKKKKKRD